MSKVFYDLLKEREKDLVDKLYDSINDNQPDTFLKLAGKPHTEMYKGQLGKLIHLLESFLAGESVDQDILDWGTRVSEDKVRQGLSLSQSIKHFLVIRDVLWDEIISIAENNGQMTREEELKIGKVINGFIDDLILIFSTSYTGMANKRLKAQQAMIDEISTPVISIVDGVAVLPIIGDIDTHRARVLREHTLRETNRQKVDCLILDLSGVFIVDTMVAQELFKIINSLKLTGVDVNLTGMRPELAHSVVSLGISFDNVKMYNNLEQALKAFGVVRK
ncbi:STAS domain-containing protein [Bacillus sp. ISL-35]|uniref:STAS domain-containing protein n=1 Tax=Bacillus sp. ISL-35 TaxID=2819122 RepID=UPI001BE4FE2E|nr:STAS domain-containing protein [Bacillus sp. ISL-35]MBT2680849.1 STAS domain-containing protein [Bacillus sp. ISL-35]MBT2705165.1 STAS domain-containing protein [Chryseobacterium sp. ISL-80]